NNIRRSRKQRKRIKHRTPKPFTRPIRVIKGTNGKDIYQHYKIGKELGRGEFGVSYECQDITTGERVACKKISKSKLRAQIDVEDVRREVSIMRHMPLHPNIVTFKDVYEDKDAIYLVMEICEGGELFDRIVAKGHYTERAAALVIKTILEVVQCPRECNNMDPKTEEGIAQAIIQGDINFIRDPWQRVSEDAKKLVKGMLDQDPYDRLTVEEALENHWIQNAHKVSIIPLGENVRSKIQQFSLMNKFKKKVITVVAENLPDEQVDGLKQMFDEMDKDKNGMLTFEEFKDGLCSIGDQPLDDHDVRMLMDAADLDENGVLNCEEFMMVAIHLKRISNDDHLRQAFHHFDKNKNGYIEFDELKESLFEEQNSHNEKLVNDIIHDADLDKDGRISYPEFAAMMTTGMDWKMASRQYSRVKLNAISVKMFKDQSKIKTIIE
ncbi:hypothetical protein M8C21_030531, partial [Ambrosia artemisiifolia]